MNSQNSRILVVDDTPENIDILASILRSDYDVMVASNGKTALKIAQSSTPPDLILLDVMMPEMDGFKVCETLKNNPATKRIPVVFVTANTDKDSISKGIKLGAYYYLTKPIKPSIVLAIVETALHQFSEYRFLQQELEKATSTMKLMSTGCFYFRTLTETRILAFNLAKIVPDPVKLVSGLTELMVNAVEHGNLGISYDEKGYLNQQRSWNQEVERRLALPENQDKKANICVERNDSEVCFTITDQGDGFDWKPYLEIDADRADHSHGRGIAMSRMLTFSDIEFQGKGNKVVAKYVF